MQIHRLVFALHFKPGHRLSLAYPLCYGKQCQILRDLIQPEISKRTTAIDRGDRAAAANQQLKLTE